MKPLNILPFCLGLYCFGAAAVDNLPTALTDPASSISLSEYGETLFGGWGGKRHKMSANGYDWEIVYKLDVIANASKPNRKIYGLDNLDIKLLLDGEKITGIKGSSGFLYVLSNRGGKPALRSDRLPHGLDNIETPYNANTTKLYQAWIQQTFWDERVSVRAGLYDFNSEFYVNESAGIFIHPTFGIGAEMGGSGKNGPSIFPTTSVALRVKVEPVPGYYLQAVTLDGVPGDPDDPHGTHIQFNKGDGALNVIEGEIPLGVSDDPHDNKWTLGVWRYTSRFDDVLDKDVNGLPIQRISRGVYTTVEKVLLHKSDTNEESVRGFVRVGKNDGDTIQFDMAWSAGLLFEGPIHGREKDIAGFGVAQERNSTKYRAVAVNSQVSHENSLELTYRYLAMPGLVLQPMVQYLINHSNDPAQDKSWWLGMRFEASF